MDIIGNVFGMALMAYITNSITDESSLLETGSNPRLMQQLLITI